MNLQSGSVVGTLEKTRRQLNQDPKTLKTLAFNEFPRLRIGFKGGFEGFKEALRGFEGRLSGEPVFVRFKVFLSKPRTLFGGFHVE